jgi:hypothetical protein
MISIFNGRERSLGGEAAHSTWARIDVEFRDVLKYFKGAPLAVFISISLHADEDGWSWPSVDLLSRETGYDDDTIRLALTTLCNMIVRGHRVLLRGQPRNRGGQWANNHYLIFPTPEEVAEHDVATALRQAKPSPIPALSTAPAAPQAAPPSPENPVPAGENRPSPGFPAPGKPVPENPVINQNHSEPDQIDDDDAARARGIDSILSHSGIENPTRLQLVTIWCRQVDGVETINRITSRTCDELLTQEQERGNGKRKIKSFSGLVVSRLRGEFEERTGKSATAIPPPLLEAVRATVAAATLKGRWQR